MTIIAKFIKQVTKDYCVKPLIINKEIPQNLQHFDLQEYEQQLKAYGIPVQSFDWKQIPTTTSPNVMVESFSVKDEQPILSPSSSVVNNNPLELLFPTFYYVIQAIFQVSHITASN